ncbi:MAG: ABC transporter permease [Alphaproteobacteria bacterium]|nr:ABC transporter permease [Alphaproteobacteria bacterium]
MPHSMPFKPRLSGPVNWLGLWTLCAREIQRFLKVYAQTILAPVVTALIFFAIFTLALGRQDEVTSGLPFALFLTPGLVMMSVIQNAFANTSSSLMIAKIQGNIVDTLMPPLSAAELTIGYASGGVVRGVLVGVVTGTALFPFVGIHLHNVWFLLFHALAASLMLSLLGTIFGIWAEKFDHIAAVTNFVIMPLAFLSGTFYSIERLPDAWHWVAMANPFFYAIDGFRYGMTGHADGSLGTGVGALVCVNLVLLVLCHRMFKTGYRLKP